MRLYFFLCLPLASVSTWSVLELIYTGVSNSEGCCIWTHMPAPLRHMSHGDAFETSLCPMSIPCSWLGHVRLGISTQVAQLLGFSEKCEIVRQSCEPHWACGPIDVLVESYIDLAPMSSIEGSQRGLTAGLGTPQAQCILFRRYPEVLAPFKYAGYPLLLRAVELPPDDGAAEGRPHFLAPEAVPQLQVRQSKPCLHWF